MKKNCSECGEDIKGRADKKFCSDQCRSSYNNRKNKDLVNFIRNVNNTLRRNRRILAELNPDGKTRIRRDKLAEKGFQFHYFTNEYRTKSGNVYRFCYDQGYLIIDEVYCTLVVRKDYV